MYVCMYRSRARNIKETAACELVGAKKGRNVQFYSFLKVILHKLHSIPHAIPLIHSVFYPHRLICQVTVQERT